MGELVVVLEVDLPDREALVVKVLVEPLDRAVGTAGVKVRVLALPLLEVEGRLREVVKGVLDLDLGGDEGLLLLGLGLLLLGGSLGLLGGLGLLLLLGLLSLGGGDEGGLLLNELEALVDLGELGRADDSGNVADNVGDLGAEGRVDQLGEGVGNGRGDEDVGDGEALANEEGLLDEDLVEDGEALNGVLDNAVEDGLRVGVDTTEDLAGNAELDEDLLVGERLPLADLSKVLGVGGDKVGVGGKGSDCVLLAASCAGRVQVHGHSNSRSSSNSNGKTQRAQRYAVPPAKVCRHKSLRQG